MMQLLDAHSIESAGLTGHWRRCEVYNPTNACGICHHPRYGVCLVLFAGKSLCYVHYIWEWEGVGGWFALLGSGGTEVCRSVQTVWPVMWSCVGGNLGDESPVIQVQVGDGSRHNKRDSHPDHLKSCVWVYARHSLQQQCTGCRYLLPEKFLKYCMALH